MKKYYYIFLFFALFACENYTEQNQAQIIGEWHASDSRNMNVYIFEDDEICRKEVGFFEYADSTQPTVENPFLIVKNNELPDISTILNNVIRYYRSHSCYEIEHDKLKIYDPSLKTWHTQYINFKTTDTLILSNIDKEKQYKYYRRKKMEISEESLFDRIIFYFPPTIFSSCGYYSINRSQELFIYGDNGRRNNFIPATVEEGLFEKLEKLFKQANIETYLDSFLETDITSCSLDKPYIVFFRDNKMYTFNSDFGLIRSDDQKAFYQAYFSTLYYIKNIEFQPHDDFKASDVFYRYKNISLWQTNSGETKIKLSDFEVFYLASLIYFSPETTKTFLPVYKAKDKNAYNDIKTNGQFFTYWTSFGDRTVDIGFNFIEEHGLD